MHIFQIDGDLAPRVEPNPVADNCWLARQVLATFMGEACDLGADDDGTDDVPDLIYEGDGDGLSVHDTPCVPLNAKFQAFLSNVPLITGLDGGIIPFTQSGYVSLQAEDRNEEPVRTGLDAVIEQDESRGQIIFHLPRPGVNEAEIFDGYSLESTAGIPITSMPRLRRIKRLLEFMQSSLRDLCETDLAIYQTLYHANAPRGLEEASLSDDELQQFFQ
ncbi:MAG: hypothetical protein ABI220_00200 [Candidatus Saccharimonadales bacterium]